MHAKHKFKNSLFFLFLLCCSIVINAPFSYADQTIEPKDFDRPLNLQACTTYYQKYEPAFYTGFAPRSRNPKRLHLHVGRGNQLRVTLVLSDEVLEAYVLDIRSRYTTYRTKIEDGTLQLTQNSAFEKFEETVKELGELQSAESQMERQDIIERNLALMTRLNPGMIFHINIPINAVIQHWLNFLKPADFQKIDPKRRLAIVNEMLPTRLWSTSLSKETTAQLDELIQLAAKNRETESLRERYLALLDKVSEQIYSRGKTHFDFYEFTALYPIGTFNGYTTCIGGQKIPMYPTPGKWTLTTHQRTKTVDHIPDISIYSWFPWIPYMHVGKKLHNSFHTLWWTMEYAKTDFLPEELKKPKNKSREGKDYRYLWLLSRGPMSHGCTHVNSGHILELRQLLPADEKAMYDVVFFLNKSCLFDVFDIDGDLTPEVMGVRYFVAYTLNNKKPGKLRAPMERRPFYNWLYGGALKYDITGRGYFEAVSDGRFVNKKAVAGEKYKKLYLYEAEPVPFHLQFFKMKNIDHVRELRKAGEDYSGTVQ